MEHRELWLGWAAAVALTVGVGTLPRTWPAGPAITVPVAAPGWQVQGDGAVEVNDGVAHLASTSSDGVEWWHPLRLGRDGRWRLTAEARAAAPCEVCRAVLRTDGEDEPRLWFGTRRIRSEGWEERPRELDADLVGRDLLVGAVARGEGAQLAIRRLSVRPVRSSPLWGVGRVVGGLLWLGVAGAVGVRTVRSLGRARTALLVGMIAVGGVFGLASIDLLRASGVTPWVQKIVGHVGGFGALGAFLGRSGLPPGAAVARVAALGVTLEALQGWSVSRSGTVEDVGLDVVGAALGWWLGRRIAGQEGT